MKPLYTNFWGELLDYSGKSATSVVTLDYGCAGLRAVEHFADKTFGYLHRLRRVNRIGNVDDTVRINGIA